MQLALQTPAGFISRESMLNCVCSQSKCLDRNFEARFGHIAGQPLSFFAVQQIPSITWCSAVHHLVQRYCMQSCYFGSESFCNCVMHATGAVDSRT